MKTSLLSMAFCALFSLSFSTQSAACVETHPDSIRVFINTDSLCNIEIRVTNLQLMGGSPNEFCSCAIAGAFQVGIDLTYIAFVDSITQEPIEGFDPWMFLPEASESWEDVDPLTLDWSGFVSDVNASGLLQGQAVDLIIRGQISSGWACDYEGELIYAVKDQMGIGTDEWDNDAIVLANSHQDITYFTDLPWSDISHTIVQPSYFDALDSVILGLERVEGVSFGLFPNPATDQFAVQTTATINQVTVISGDGRIIDSFFPTGKLLVVNTASYATGLYLVRVQAGNTYHTQQLLVN
jgi:hypothetical protein